MSKRAPEPARKPGRPLGAKSTTRQFSYSLDFKTGAQLQRVLAQVWRPVGEVQG